MNCEATIKKLLEADPAALAGHGDPALAAHLRECERCAAIAARLLDGQALLEARLAAFRPRESADEAAERAIAAGRTLTREGTRETGPARRRRLHRVAAALPLAAAAVLALLMPGHEPTTPPAPLPIPQPRAAAVPSVRIPAGRDAAIFRTANPKITVVWIY